MSKDNSHHVIPNQNGGWDVKRGNSKKAKVVYNNFETDLLSEESVSVKKLFEIICPIIDILENDRILICDELLNSEL